MADGFFSFTPFDFNESQGGCFLPDYYDYEKQETEFRDREDHSFRLDDFGDFNFISAETGLNQQNITKNGDQENYQQSNLDNLALEEFLFNNNVTTAESIREQPNMPEYGDADPINVEPIKQILDPWFESLQLLSKLSVKFKKVKSSEQRKIGSETSQNNRKLSTEEIFRVAGGRYVQYFPHGSDDLFIPIHHPFGFALCGLSVEETKDVELAHILFAAAEKVGYQQYDRASKLLHHCEWISSPLGNAVERIVFYFSKALRRRIEREMGRTKTKEPKRDVLSNFAQGRGMNLKILESYQKLPFAQLMHLTAVQTIFEHTKPMSKVHLIDLEIRNGVHWVAFMQSLVDLKGSRVKHLKITALGLHEFVWIEKVGKRLEGVAKSLSLSFSFKAVLVSNMMDIKQELFEIEDSEEGVAIYSPLVLRTMISRPICLENLMRVLRKLNPSIMVVSEIESNQCSLSFVNRFIEALFFNSAYFDCMDTCMGKEDESRRIIERLFGEVVENVVASEGSERVARSVKIEVWRAFFERFEMEEIQLSEACLNQAKLVSKGFHFGEFCCLENNGKCFIFGWKETPILSVSAWLFE